MQYATDVDISITGVAQHAYGVYTLGFSGSITDVTVDLDLSAEGFYSKAYGYGFSIEVDNSPGYVGVVQGCTATVRVRDDDRSEDLDYGIDASAAAYGIVVRAYAP